MPLHDARERRVPFVGITNLRDLGGYPTTSGGETRWGLVFRADALHKLTDDDLETFHGLGGASSTTCAATSSATSFLDAWRRCTCRSSDVPATPTRQLGRPT